jgi:hypothetical protein
MTDRIKERVSTQVNRQLPEFVQVGYEQFVTFVERYYEFLEQDQGAQEVIQNAKNYRDIDETIDSLSEAFFRTFGPDVPRSLVANKSIVIKYLRDFFKAKGNRNSYNYLFRILFNEEISIFYPNEFTLKASDGVWDEKKVIKVAQVLNDPFRLKDVLLVGANSGAKALVTDVLKIRENNLDVFELKLDRSSIEGEFLSNEVLSGTKVVSKTVVSDQNLATSFSGNNYSYVSQLYTTYFNRDPVYAEINYWTNLLNDRRITRRKLEYDTFLTGETLTVVVRPYNLVTSIKIINGGLGYTINTLINIDSKDYKATGYVTNVDEFGSIREIKLRTFQPRSNLDFNPNVTPTVELTSPTLYLKGNYTTDNTILTANLFSPHGLTRGAQVSIRFTGNSNSYLNNSNNIFTVASVPSKNKFTANLGSPDVNTYGMVTITYLNAANLQANTGTIATYQGKWKEDKGFLSEDIVLQGPTLKSPENSIVKFQPYSYVIETRQRKDSWEAAVKNLLHPVGLGLFNNLKLDSLVVKETSNANAWISFSGNGFTSAFATFDSTLITFDSTVYTMDSY